jgi:hypothetical protein
MKKLITSLAIASLLYGCFSDIRETVNKINDVDAIQWDPIIAVPLAYSNLSLTDLL